MSVIIFTSMFRIWCIQILLWCCSIFTPPEALQVELAEGEANIDIAFTRFVQCGHTCKEMEEIYGRFLVQAGSLFGSVLGSKVRKMSSCLSDPTHLHIHHGMNIYMNSFGKYDSWWSLFRGWMQHKCCSTWARRKRLNIGKFPFALQAKLRQWVQCKISSTNFWWL